MNDEPRSGMREAVVQVSAAAASVPVVIGFTLLGAGVVMGRALIGFFRRLLPLAGMGEPVSRHHVGRVRDQVKAAKRAARGAGVLRRPS